MRTLVFVLAGLAMSAAHAGVVDEMLRQYQRQGANAFDGEVGKSLWTKSFGTNAEGHARKCSTCHSADLRNIGKHVKTGKTIDPLAPSRNRERLTDAAEIEKWFKRNCQWTLGRECSAQEKGDFLTYIRTQ